ncbi:MAG: hypothetical protein KBB39_10365 [Phycicoccus sp.]|nr:hypothetical protein [Phycicoccus sp.]
MSVDPRAAMAVFQTALERHLEASLNRRGDDDPAVAAAYEDLVDAFEAYDTALFDATGEMTPLDIYDDSDDEDGESDDDEVEDDDESDDEDDEDDDDDDDDEDDDQSDESLDDHDDEDGDTDHVYLGLDGLDFDEADPADVKS